MTLQVKHAGLSDIGRVRHENQDRWLAAADQGLYFVADGMGGAAGGGLASEIVVEAVPRLLEKRMKGIADLTRPEAAEKLLGALAELSDRLRSESRDQFGRGGVGSTVVLALVRDGHALIAHMGDSRAYLLRDGRLEQLTTDHTIVQLLISSGDIRPEEAADHPARGQLTRYVGMQGEPLPEARLVELQPGDRLLLCSDGLTGLVSDESLRAVLQENTDLEKTCRRLIDEANRAGGKDNITALVVSVLTKK